ncbi:MAG TPA: hypothetical protein VHI52_22305 [Verrucomicrobiae bacterium]|nr:hypothetical protein [Verrucomicrobiae bacterium]HVX83328.1 hypothetical protein [Phycisphaerae bacterium]HVZ80668.1 hypothetical protein [bacterium]
MSKLLGTIIALFGVAALIPAGGGLLYYVNGELPRALILQTALSFLIAALCLIAAFHLLRASAPANKNRPTQKPQTPGTSRKPTGNQSSSHG